MATTVSSAIPSSVVSPLFYLGLSRPRPLPRRSVPGLTFSQARHASSALEKLTFEEAEERIQLFQHTVEQAEFKVENKDFFIDQLLLNNRPISESSLITLAANASGVGLLHLADRSDLTENVNLVAAASNIGRYLNREPSIHVPFQDPNLPDWMIRLGVETVLVEPRKLSDGDSIYKMFAYTLPTGLLQNPTLPVLARAKLTIPEVWDWKDFHWRDGDETRMKSSLQEQVAVEFPELADLPAQIVISTLQALPLDDPWGVVPSEHEPFADIVREAIQVRQLEIAEGEELMAGTTTTISDSDLMRMLEELSSSLSQRSAPAHKLGSVLATKPNQLPSWLAELVATVMVERHRRFTPTKGMAADAHLMLERVRLPLPVRARLAQLPGHGDERYWFYEDKELVGGYQQELEEQFPELVGLPLPMLLSVLATQPVPDLLRDVPEDWFQDVQYIIVKMGRQPWRGTS